MVFKSQKTNDSMFMYYLYYILNRTSMIVHKLQPMQRQINTKLSHMKFSILPLYKFSSPFISVFRHK